MKFRKYIQITSVLTVFFVLVFIKNALGGSRESSIATSPNPTMIASSPSTRASQYKDGTFTGSVADASYGNVQIQVVVSGGKITQVKFLQYPNDQRTSQSINIQAMPLLQSEVITAQSEKVTGVSGASQTSDAFVRSLGNALAQALAI